MASHLLHENICNSIYNLKKTGYEIYVDTACGQSHPVLSTTKQNLPFFFDGAHSNATEITNVDLIITKDDKIVLICEIEESAHKPIHIYGKFFSLLSSQYGKVIINKTAKKLDFSDKIIFLQVVSEENLPQGSSKPKQWENIEKSIQSMISSHFPKFKYYLLHGRINDFSLRSRNHGELIYIMNQL